MLINQIFNPNADMCELHKLLSSNECGSQAVYEFMMIYNKEKDKKHMEEAQEMACIFEFLQVEKSKILEQEKRENFWREDLILFVNENPSFYKQLSRLHNNFYTDLIHGDLNNPNFQYKDPKFSLKTLFKATYTEEWAFEKHIKDNDMQYAGTLPYIWLPPREVTFDEDQYFNEEYFWESLFFFPCVLIKDFFEERFFNKKFISIAYSISFFVLLSFVIFFLLFGLMFLKLYCGDLSMYMEDFFDNALPHHNQRLILEAIFNTYFDSLAAQTTTDTMLGDEYLYQEHKAFQIVANSSSGVLNNFFFTPLWELLDEITPLVVDKTNYKKISLNDFHEYLTQSIKNYPSLYDLKLQKELIQDPDLVFLAPNAVEFNYPLYSLNFLQEKSFLNFADLFFLDLEEEWAFSSVDFRLLDLEEDERGHAELLESEEIGEVAALDLGDLVPPFWEFDYYFFNISEMENIVYQGTSLYSGSEEDEISMANNTPDFDQDVIDVVHEYVKYFIGFDEYMFFQKIIPDNSPIPVLFNSLPIEEFQKPKTNMNLFEPFWFGKEEIFLNKPLGLSDSSELQKNNAGFIFITFKSLSIIKFCECSIRRFV